jgi:hypothetical protein
VRHHAVGGRVEPGNGVVVGEQCAQMRLRHGGEDGDGRFVPPEVVEKELAEPLPVE